MSGEKWPTQLLTETQVGKATPFSIFFFFEYSSEHASTIIVSPASHNASGVAPGVARLSTFASALEAMSPARRYFVTISGSDRSFAFVSSCSSSLLLASDIVRRVDAPAKNGNQKSFF